MKTSSSKVPLKSAIRTSKLMRGSIFRFSARDHKTWVVLISAIGGNVFLIINTMSPCVSLSDESLCYALRT